MLQQALLGVCGAFAKTVVRSTVQLGLMDEFSQSTNGTCVCHIMFYRIWISVACVSHWLAYLFPWLANLSYWLAWPLAIFKEDRT